jgi:hypothetical protein
MRLDVVIIGAMTIFVAGRIGAAEPTNVGMVQLLANPEKFHGKFIRVEGFLRLEFEGDALYLHREDYANGLTKNAVWVDMPQDGQHTKLNMHYVLIEGVFDSKDLGHMGLFSGSIGKIRRAIPWK